MKNKIQNVVRKVGRPSTKILSTPSLRPSNTNTTQPNITVNNPNITSNNPINIFINILTKLAVFIAWFSPFIWLKDIFKFIKLNIKTFIASFTIIKDAFDYLNGLPVFQLFRNIIRILSFLSLLLNIIILTIFTEFDLYSWVYTIPGISNIGAFVYEKTPESTQNFFNWLTLKIKIFLLWIWHGVIDFIKSIIKAVLGSIESDPDLKIPNKREIHNEISHDNLALIKDHFYDYKFYYLLGSGLILISILGYIYWDSICSCWRRPGDDPNINNEPFIALPFQPEIHTPNQTLPSPDSSNSSHDSTLNKYFRSPIIEKTRKYTSKIKEFITSKAKKPQFENFPSGVGLYQQNGKDYWNGLPLPRVENLQNGSEYYFIKDKNGFIRAITNRNEDVGKAFIIDPISGNAINYIDIPVVERINILNITRTAAFYNAPANSFARNPVLDTSIPSEFDNIPLGPTPLSLVKGKEKAFDSPTSSGSITPTGSRTPTQEAFYDMPDPFNDSNFS